MPAPSKLPNRGTGSPPPRGTASLSKSPEPATPSAKKKAAEQILRLHASTAALAALRDIRAGTAKRMFRDRKTTKVLVDRLPGLLRTLLRGNAKRPFLISALEDIADALGASSAPACHAARYGGEMWGVQLRCSFARSPIAACPRFES